MSAIVIDVAVNPLPHNCIHFNRRNFSVSNGEAIAHRKEFREEFRLLCPATVRKRRLKGPLSVRLLVWRRGRFTADGDNLQKEIFDAITNAQVWEDDSQVRDCHWTVVQDGPRVKPRIRVEIYPLALDEVLEHATNLTPSTRDPR